MFRNFYESYKPQNHRCHSLFKSQSFDDVTFHHAFDLIPILKSVLGCPGKPNTSRISRRTVQGELGLLKPRANVFKTSFLSEKASFCQKFGIRNSRCGVRLVKTSLKCNFQPVIKTLIRSILTHTSTYNQNQPDFLLPQILISISVTCVISILSRKKVRGHENSRKA